MKLVSLLIVALALAACASSPTSGTSTTAEKKTAEEKEFRTGSRIPVRDGASSSELASPSAVNPALPPKM